MLLNILVLMKLTEIIVGRISEPPVYQLAVLKPAARTLRSRPE